MPAEPRRARRHPCPPSPSRATAPFAPAEPVAGDRPVAPRLPGSTLARRAAGPRRRDRVGRRVGARRRSGRTRAVEILRGGRSKALLERSYDGLPEYGTFDDLTAHEVLARVDELLEEGRLRSTGGAFPKLAAVPAEYAAA